MKAEVLFGVHPVNEALKAGRRAIDQIWIATEKQSRPKAQIQMLAEQAQIPVERVRPSELKAITGTDRHQGIGAKASP
ncbi:MAG: 23S rRNA (guanosine(2251)-2'-O)-methyltransferase RlmB, partial [Deltaproteobacteria bacterium]|nr:23S rRNA (guanosine(2251)-2'-O)-methyltransferase RlmB [Deltaproteobacteria bacterium]